MVVVVVYAVLLDVVPARAVEVRGLEYPRVLQDAWIRIDVFGHGTRLLSLDALRTYRATSLVEGTFSSPTSYFASPTLASSSLRDRRAAPRLPWPDSARRSTGSPACSRPRRARAEPTRTRCSARACTRNPRSLRTRPPCHPRLPARIPSRPHRDRLAP